MMFILCVLFLLFFSNDYLCASNAMFPIEDLGEAPLSQNQPSLPVAVKPIDIHYIDKEDLYFEGDNSEATPQYVGSEPINIPFSQNDQRPDTKNSYDSKLSFYPHKPPQPRKKSVVNTAFSKNKESCHDESIFKAYFLESTLYAPVIEKLNNGDTFEAARDALFQLACAGIFEIIDWFCDPKQGNNLKRLYPGKAIEAFLLHDLQKTLNEEAYDYYLDTIFPKKEQMLPALKEALKRGFSRETIYTRTLWVLYNDINTLSLEERGPWIEKFEGIQSLGYKKGIIDSVERMFDRHTLNGLM